MNIDRGPVHIVSTEDMARVTGTVMAEDAPVETVWGHDQPIGERMAALCGFVVQDLSGTHAEAASIRALRRDPGLFEGERMCPACCSRFEGLPQQEEATHG